ncbi:MULTISPECIES: class I SAM-dependent methyltransferase [unclassified Marinitoga]|uniref:class I SAM-dependent methyltransferase n=1 Tax=unclassified Marinitoga TaxID=2640159 RepID=UPI0006410463|nr:MULTISPECIES: class I SAM-dependent methyltransferase [unclassified Marinitoga]KLO21667.1 methyltransferase [Marinitoga sp. 1155]NUU99861.1 methyltransferase [Marinitoga sp. 1154]
MKISFKEIEIFLKKLGYEKNEINEFIEQIKHFEEEAPDRDEIVKSYLNDKCINVIVEEISNEIVTLNNKHIRLLDVAAGSGFFTEKIIMNLKEKGISVDPYALDLTPSMLNRLEERNIKTIWGIAERIKDSILISNDYYKEKKPEKFDVVISTLAFHHFLEPEKVLKSFRNVLNKNGKAIIIDILKHEHEEILEDLKDTHPGFSLNEIKNISKEIFTKTNADPLEAYCTVDDKKIYLYKAVLSMV